LTDLSPAARAVLDAAMQYEINPECYSRKIAAAALQSAADQVVPETDFYPGTCCERELKAVRAELLAIAAELEGGNA